MERVTCPFLLGAKDWSIRAGEEVSKPNCVTVKEEHLKSKWPWTIHVPETGGVLRLVEMGHSHTLKQPIAWGLILMKKFTCQLIFCLWSRHVIITLPHFETCWRRAKASICLIKTLSNNIPHFIFFRPFKLSFKAVLFEAVFTPY